MFLANDMMYDDDVPFVVLLKNPKNSREAFQHNEETLRPVITKKVAGTHPIAILSTDSVGSTTVSWNKMNTL